IAHLMLQHEVERYGRPENLILYLDGPPAEEKRTTTDLRDKMRLKALEDLGGSLNTFDKKLSESSRIRKQLHVAIAKGFRKSFYWCLDIRYEFAEHMRNLGWKVQVGPTESYVAIARASKDGDIVISGDSDMMAYSSITTVWRPVSNDLIFVYNIPDVLKTLQISRVQLTALAIVSKNDYSRNIYSLGPTTNFGVIKKQIGFVDARGVVAAYLRSEEVVASNKSNEMFETAMRVFIDYQQTPIHPVVPRPRSQDMFDLSKQRYSELYELWDSCKQEARALRTSRIADRDPILRLPQPKTVNRYKT
ncbi:hypothetical protein EC991_010942, partial [Linnemannia zychae]